MKKLTCLLGILGFFALVTGIPATTMAAETGETAPDFTLKNTAGDDVSLSDFAGQKVILEWTNHLCPYVAKHYNSENMQSLQAEMTSQNITWLTILSSAPGKQGYLEGHEAAALMSEKNAAQTAYLLDPTGEVGKLYDAKTSPHMYLIDEDGILQYQGAIDDDNSAAIESVATANNYVLAALEDLKAGRPVANPVTQAYGCSIKYQD